MDAEKANFTVEALCRVLEVTRQGYYAWLARRAARSERLSAEAELHAHIRKLHDNSKETYGSPRIHEALQAANVRVGKRRVERAMRAMDLRGCQPRRRFRKPKATPEAIKAENVLDRDFQASRPDERWVTDTTYIWTDDGWCFLAVILDLFSRSIVGWSMDCSLNSQLSLKALDMAVRRRRPKPGLLHHSDRGVEFTNTAYQVELQRQGIKVSLSRPANCWDNAVAESFFGTLKKELVNRRRWATPIEVRAAVFDYIETYYNRRRLHSTLGYKTPAQVEEAFKANLAA